MFSWLYNHVIFSKKLTGYNWWLRYFFNGSGCIMYRIYNCILRSLRCGVLFVMLGSPWVVSIVRNLYWVPVLWLLPALIAMWLYRFQNEIMFRRYLYGGFFFAVLIKCLTGYEYLSAVLLLATAVFFVDPFHPNSRYGFARCARIIATLFAISVGAFLCAFVLHASIRGNSLMQGMQITFELDAFKYSSLNATVGAISRGTEMPLFEVLRQYIFTWDTPVLYWVQDNLFFPLLVTAGYLSIFIQYVCAEKYRHRDVALLFIMMISSISWMVLMKGHSVIHVHLNYVLWYFGFIPALVFVVLRGFVLTWHEMKSLYLTNFSKTDA